MGDLLFQVVLQSQLSEEEGNFTIDDVIEGICAKMVQRHPHVFGKKDITTSEEVEEWWEENKRNQGKAHASAIGGVPRSLPSLLRARKIQQKATKVGFDWNTMDDVFRKIDEEVHELREAVARNEQGEIEDELGDLFFVLVRVANAMNVNAEKALSRTIRKFTRRFHFIEEEAARAGRAISDMSLAEMEELWQRAKGEQDPQ
jgi:tetrapyrrole methylase family protein/MazG family protein